jgi:hypothetical protein
VAKSGNALLSPLAGTGKPWELGAAERAMDLFGRTPEHVACIVGDADRLAHHPVTAAHHPPMVRAFYFFLLNLII